MQRWTIVNCFLSFLFFLTSLSAKANQERSGGLNSPYVSMWTPEGWVCPSFPPNYICHSKSMQRDKPFFVVISAKMGSTQDTLSQYKNQSQSLGFQEVRSLNINSHPWLDFLPFLEHNKKHLLRSQVTLCCDEFNYKFHTVISFYVSSLGYSEYLSLIVRMINSFELKKRNAREIAELLASKNDGRELQDYISNILSEEEQAQLRQSKSPNKKLSLWYWFFLPLFLFLAYYLIQKKKRKRKKKRYRKRRARKSKN